jgi:glutamyl-tRNA synthetase
MDEERHIRQQKKINKVNFIIFFLKYFTIRKSMLLVFHFVLTFGILVMVCSFSCAFRLHSRSFSSYSILRRSQSSLSAASSAKLITKAVRVRFAPSPTGSLHIGGARTALFNWLLAKKTKGTFIIRVEDTDEARSTRESEASILSDLRWLKLDWQEGPDIADAPHAPYRQSERKHIYREVADQLVSDGKAYRCFCTEEELEAKKSVAVAREDPDPGRYDGTCRKLSAAIIEENLAQNKPYVIRFKITPPGKIVSIDDMVRGKVTWEADKMLGDFILLRSNGMPVYNFCVSVDDAKMKITHVIRAEEHLSNTLRQMLILEAMNYKPPVYAHCSLILGSDRSKLSKRHGATSLSQFASQGYIPEAMMNYLANLGWNDGTPKEIYTQAELIAAFDMSRIIKSQSQFDVQKLKWINQQHLRNLTNEKMQDLVIFEMLRDGQKQFQQQRTLIDAEQANSATATSSSTDLLALPPSFPPLLTEGDSQYKNHPNYQEFLQLATKIVQRDIELTVDTNRLLGNCLQYHPDFAIRNDSHITEILNTNLTKVTEGIIQDYETNNFPNLSDDKFNELFKNYVKGLGTRLGLKGKDLFHPLRFCLTGRMSGPDIGDQLKFLSLSNGIIRNDYPICVLNDRIKYLKEFSLDKSLKDHQHIQVPASVQQN